MIAHIVAWAVPVAGLITCVFYQRAPNLSQRKSDRRLNSTRTGTSANPEGDDRRQVRR